MKKTLIITFIALLTSYLLLILPYGRGTGFDGLVPGIVFYWLIAPLCLVVVLVATGIRLIKQWKKPASNTVTITRKRDRSTDILLIVAFLIILFFGVVGIAGFMDNF